MGNYLENVHAYGIHKLIQLACFSIIIAFSVIRKLPLGYSW